MVANPIPDTEPRVQRLLVGSYRKTGMWSQGLAGVGLCVLYSDHTSALLDGDFLYLWTTKTTK